MSGADETPRGKPASPTDAWGFWMDSEGWAESGEIKPLAGADLLELLEGSQGMMQADLSKDLTFPKKTVCSEACVRTGHSSPRSFAAALPP